MKLRNLDQLKERVKLRDDLLSILETEEGKRFFKVFLRECHVTKPVFHEDDKRLREAEGRRRLAMTFLTLIAEDDPQKLINKLELENSNE
jgi:hypothetical protein|tara:strand:- start:44 stop:313 length:270 start_codon:yes stop_codon:yes gene_type:complete